ncbi:xanthine dehydrogenase accessory protein XdhC [Oceanibacterium hippocampi]|uniref:XdhC and CoxI family protein n=1 Tax=Oceanibacterium hippocampi TaxID=745714 RepID=A0A1Y5TYN0_9PROT|nr:xanthine dehydrogenase accessory protein XdhC [Oceanibacterium hippocampi]SLN75992.1 XdhC and CoxI family protein [Oceanibacterium hippocampi]
MSRLFQEIAKAAAGGWAVRVTVIRAEGSAPRGPGAGMTVTATGLDGTVGGGALEFDAIAEARKIGAAGEGAWPRAVRTYPLGPRLGQCCGGSVRLLFERYAGTDALALDDASGQDDLDGGLIVRPLDGGTPPIILRDRKQIGRDWPLSLSRAVKDMLSGARRREAALVPGGKGRPDWFVEPLAPGAIPLYLYGAGHVGRAIVAVMRGLPFRIIWVDTAAERFPDDVPEDVTRLVAAQPETVAAGAPAGAFHAVMTYSHPLDLSICHAVLARGVFGYLGLIGSATKKTRFVRRLSELGIADATIARMTCPIGIAGIAGKEPAVIAVGFVAQILQIAAARDSTCTARKNSL